MEVTGTPWDPVPFPPFPPSLWGTVDFVAVAEGDAEPLVADGEGFEGLGDGDALPLRLGVTGALLRGVSIPSSWVRSPE
ncbi:hypothetical protein [Streptomyces sp. NPDC058092]|uniref:hypothetical protein n=1 Tax=Streptomyces sp. NPDC058092 TaxID=3346336 RepID=UPI0036E44829